MASSVYRFDEFRLDPANRELWRGDEELALQPKVFACILYLVEHRDRAVAREELFAEVWGEIELSDGVAAQAILQARRALHDTGDEQHYIKTVRSFGYRWAAPVEVVELPPDAVEDSAEPRPRMRPRSIWIWAASALVAAGLVAGTMLYLSRDRRPGAFDGKALQMGEGDIALLVPVIVDPQDHHGWIRFGVMELIAERLRAAGQPMVPSETVIALMRGLPAQPDAEELQTLTATTGARLVLGAHADAIDGRWRVSVRSLDEAQPPLATRAEADDVLDAARVAADRMALSLGLTPAPEPDAEPGLAMLLRQTESAILARQLDTARELIETTRPEVRRHPEVRFQLARLDYYSHRLDAAQATFEALLETPAVQDDPMLQARIRHSLGGVHFQRGNYPAAGAVLEEGVRLLRDGGDTRGILGVMRRSLGVLALVQGRFEMARRHLARARWALKSTGDAGELASLYNNLGVLYALRERYVEALHHLERAAQALSALNDPAMELRVRVNMVEARLRLLEPQAALALEPRLNELLAQTASAEISTLGNLAKASLLAANGQSRAARNSLEEASSALESHEELPDVWRAWALVLRAEQAARADERTRAARLATEAVDLAAADRSVLAADYLGRARLLLLRARLAERDLEAAAEIAAATRDWAERNATRAPRFYAAMADAETAAAEGRNAAAEADFEVALRLADRVHLPARRLQVARVYAPWLLSAGPPGTPDPERAQLVADRVAAYADQDYDAALLQLRVAHALGPPSVWRAALVSARALAGERRIPPELLDPPKNYRNAMAE